MISDRLLIIRGLVDRAMITFSARHRLHNLVPHLYDCALLSIDQLMRHWMFFSFNFQTSLESIEFFFLYSRRKLELCSFHLLFNGPAVDPWYVSAHPLLHLCVAHPQCKLGCLSSTGHSGGTLQYSHNYSLAVLSPDLPLSGAHSCCFMIFFMLGIQL